MNLSEIAKKLDELDNWGLEGSSITKVFEFPNFPEAMTFVNNVAEIAEKDQHHPDITIRYNVVKISLTTHSEKGLTEKDFAIAEKIDELPHELSSI